MPTITPQTSSLKSFEKSDNGLKNTINYLRSARRRWALRVALGCAAFILVCTFAATIETNNTAPTLSEKERVNSESTNIELSKLD